MSNHCCVIDLESCREQLSDESSADAETDADRDRESQTMAGCDRGCCTAIVVCCCGTGDAETACC